MLMKKYFSMSQAAEVCGVNRTTIHRWVTAGKIKSYSTLIDRVLSTEEITEIENAS